MLEYEDLFVVAKSQTKYNARRNAADKLLNTDPRDIGRVKGLLNWLWMQTKALENIARVSQRNYYSGELPEFARLVNRARVAAYSLGLRAGVSRLRQTAISPSDAAVILYALLLNLRESSPPRDGWTPPV